MPGGRPVASAVGRLGHRHGDLWGTRAEATVFISGTGPRELAVTRVDEAPVTWTARRPRSPRARTRTEGAAPRGKAPSPTAPGTTARTTETPGHVQCDLGFQWSRLRDSNPRPTHYEDCRDRAAWCRCVARCADFRISAPCGRLPRPAGMACATPPAHASLTQMGRAGKGARPEPVVAATPQSPARLHGARQRTGSVGPRETEAPGRSSAYRKENSREARTVLRPDRSGPSHAFRRRGRGHGLCTARHLRGRSRLPPRSSLLNGPTMSWPPATRTQPR